MIYRRRAFRQLKFRLSGQSPDIAQVEIKTNDETYNIT